MSDDGRNPVTRDELAGLIGAWGMRPFIAIDRRPEEEKLADAILAEFDVTRKEGTE